MIGIDIDKYCYVCTAVLNCQNYSHNDHIFDIIIYRRSDFDCEILLIANCEFFHNSQSKELQVKEYAMNNITRDCAPSAQACAQICSRSRSLSPRILVA